MPRMQREYRTAMGYRILVDHDRRRKDPLSKIVLRHQALKLALGRALLGISMLEGYGNVRTRAQRRIGKPDS